MSEAESTNLLFKVIRGKESSSGPIHSPFSPVSGAPESAPLTIGDVLSALPAESLSQARIDPSTPLPVQKESIERALRSGQASLPLHEVFRACPSLFAQQIAQDDPRRVSLPAAKIVKLLASFGSPSPANHPGPEGNPAAASSVFSVATPAESPPTPTPANVKISAAKDPVSGLFSQDANWPPPPPKASGQLPDGSNGYTDSVKSSPFSFAQKADQVPNPAPANSPPTTPPSLTNPFERITALAKVPDPTPGSQAPAVPAPPAPPVVTAPSTSSNEKLRLPLPVALQFCTEEDLGIDPSLLPESVEVSLPEEVFHRQLAHGEKPCVRLAEIRLGLIPEHKVLLAAARPELKIRLPVDLFESNSGIPHPAPTSASPPKQAPAPAPAPPAIRSSFLMDGSGDESDPFAEMPMLPDWTNADPDGVARLDNNPFDFPPLPDLAEPVSTAKPVPKAEPASNFPLAPTAPPVATPRFNSFTSQEKEHTSSSVPAAKPQRSRVTSTRPGSKHRRLLLRVLLGTHEDLDAEGAIQKICKLPGVCAVACIRDNALFSYASDGSSEALSFIQQALPLRQHLLPLSQVSGLENTEIITLRSEQRLVSFALNTSLTLGILHTPSPHETELLERVTLLTTELAAMLASDDA
ncbi:hypothetical protein FEM03_12975 [Phragmitibacter flavus]|uniref:Uncharacterized protein n=1 Tax=Phragmitibacter flavus TaxID=2576071 RepID=A0A5R8KCY8_9BACT|nr:hypothetical protein [Phragmitibacter flavus]TLD70107.1 hypothetical protein FEM03_12975 [Phragmitibacter flavus]